MLDVSVGPSAVLFVRSLVLRVAPGRRFFLENLVVIRGCRLALVDFAYWAFVSY